MRVGGFRFEALTGLLTGTASAAVIMIAQATAAVAMTAQEIARIAVRVTVEINDNADGGGSGVIIARQGNTYTVVTANHVVKRPDLTYTIRTYMGKTYQVSQVQRLQPSENDPDLAVVTFDSSDKYPIATLGNSEQAAIGVNVYVSGYPALARQNRDYEFSPGIVTSRPQNAPQGYNLRYNAVTVKGMSGSPVFDASGRVVAIHGEGQSEFSVQSESGGTIPIKTGFNSAIPINTFVALRAKTGLSGSQVRVNNIPHPNDTPPYYNRGEAHHDLKDKQAAIRDYTQVIRFSPKFAFAYYNRGEARYDLGDKQGAIKDYTQAIRLSPRFALAYNKLGLVRYDLGDKQEAIKDYTQAIQFYPKYATAYYNRGMVRYELGDKQGALKDYTQAIRRNHNYTLAYYNRGKVRYDLGDKQGALEDFQQAANIYQQEGNKGEYQHVLGTIRELRR